MPALLFLWPLMNLKSMANSIYAKNNEQYVSDVYPSAGRFGRRFFTAVMGAWLALFLCSPCASAQASDGDAAPRAQASRAYNPVYPYEALIAGRSGWAEISCTIDSAGRATFLRIVGASDPAFGSAFQADLEAVEFSPPRKNGRAVMSQLTERFNFPAHPALDAVAKEVLAELRKPEPAILSVDQLDKKPESIRQPRPAYPWVQRSDGASGQAEIEFIIDRNGRPLFPRIVSATQGDFGWAAVTGVLRWRYQPPVKNGEKVDARIKVTVTFDINKSADMW